MTNKPLNRLNQEMSGVTFKPKSVLNRTTTQAITLGLAASLATSASYAEEQKKTIDLDQVQVEGQKIDDNPYAEKDAPYKANFSGDARRVKPLAETPQTIQVLTQTQLEEAGQTDLKDIVQSQPGITLGTGENGNAFGDRYIIRGHEARSDVFVDGLRDPGMTTRESFATEQIEITKGPSSTFAGRGATGGAVNSVTKQANLGRSFNKLSGGWGTDDYHRYTLDSNIVLTDDAAVRINILDAYEEAPDRAPVDRDREGIAASLFWAPTDKLDFTLDHYHLDADDTPDLGTYQNRTTGQINHNLPAYAQEQDFLKSTIDTTTLKVGYQAANNLRLENTTRYGKTDNGYVVSGASGTSAVDADGNALYDTVSIKNPAPQGWQDVEYFANVLNAFYDTEIGGMQHQFVFSGEYSNHKVLNGVYNVQNLGESNCLVNGRGGISEGYCIQNADGSYISNLNSFIGRSIAKGDWDSDWQMKTTSLAAMDTIDVTDKLSVFAGVRFDKVDLNLETQGRSEGDYDYSDNLWNGHLGFVYKVAENGNIYATYSSATNVNGGESDVGTSSGYGGFLVDSTALNDPDPETTNSFELGTKWQFNNNKLLATAAVFQTTKSDVMEGSGYDEVGTYNSGENRVRGIELGLVGNITSKFSAQVALTAMDSEVTDSYNENNIGKSLSNFADNQAFAQLRYQLTPKFSFGGNATYVSEMYAGQPDTAAGNVKVPSYTKYDLFATYRFTNNLDMRVNVGNITNEDYYLAAYRSGGFMYKGDARNAYVTVNYEF